MASKRRKKSGNGGQSQKKGSARTREKKFSASGQTNEPFERPMKRQIGQHEGAGRPPLMKK